MKKIIGILLGVLLITGSALGWGTLLISGTSSSGSSTIDYTQDANCQGAFFLNGDGYNDEYAFDQSSNHYTLTESSGDEIAVSATVPSGYSGNSRDFDHTNAGYLYASDSDVPNLDIMGANQDIAVCAWVKPDSSGSSGDYFFIVSKYASTAKQYYLYATYKDATHVDVSFAISSDNTTTTSTGAYSLTVGTWYHLCGNYDDSAGSDNLQLWVDGTQQAAVNFTDGIGNTTTTASFMIGSGGNDTKVFSGLIDEVIIFDRALSSVEINDIKDNGITGDKGGTTGLEIKDAIGQTGATLQTIARYSTDVGYMGEFSPTSSYTLYKFILYMYRDGDLSGKTFNCGVQTYNGTDPSGSFIGETLSLQGLEITPQDKVFSYSSGNEPSLTNGSDYAVVIQANQAADSSNFVDIKYLNTGIKDIKKADSTPTWTSVDSTATTRIMLIGK